MGKSSITVGGKKIDSAMFVESNDHQNLEEGDLIESNVNFAQQIQMSKANENLKQGQDNFAQQIQMSKANKNSTFSKGKQDGTMDTNQTESAFVAVTKPKIEAMMSNFNEEAYEILNLDKVDLDDMTGFDKRKMMRKSSIDGEQFGDILDQMRSKTDKIREAVLEVERAESEKQTFIAQMAKEKGILNQEVELKQEALKTTQKKLKNVKAVVGEATESKEAIELKVNNLQTHNENLKVALLKIEKKISSKEDDVSKKNTEILDATATLVSKKDELTQEKKRLKAMAKEEVVDLEKKLEATNKKLAKVQAKIEQGLGEEIAQAFQERKEVYSAKEKELALVNKDIN